MNNKVRWFGAYGLVLGLLSLLLLNGCATPPLPDTSPQRALYADLRQVVETRQRTSWFLDEEQVTAAAPTAMRSTCVLTPEEIAGLDRWLDERIELDGGPARTAFLEGGKSLDELDEVMVVERVQLLLRHAEGRRQECPFWLERDEDFKGIHSDEDRFVIWLQSNGGGSLILSEGKLGFGGEGGGQLILAGGFTENFALGFGGELGGRGAVESGSSSGESLSANVTVAAPLVFRFSWLTRVLDVEVAMTAVSPLDQWQPRPGVRFLVAGGLRASRLGLFMPVVMGMVNYELQPAFGGLPTTHIFRLGTRVGIDYDP